MEKFYKYLYLIVFLIVSGKVIFANDHLLEKFNLKATYESNEVLKDSKLIYYDGSSLFLAKNNLNNIIIDNMSNNISYKLILPTNIEFDGIITFLVSNDTVFYNDWMNLYAFKLKVDSSIFLFKLTLNYTYNEIKKLNNIIYLLASHITSRGYDNYKYTIVEKFYLDRHKRSLAYFPNPSGIGLSFLAPNNVIDIDKKSIFISDFDAGKIKKYNYESVLLDSICFKDTNWVNQIGTEFEPMRDEYLNINKYLKRVNPFLNNYNRIHRIDLIQDNLLICWSPPYEKEKEINFVYNFYNTIDNLFYPKTFISYQVSNVRDETSIKTKNIYRVCSNYLIVFENGTTKDLFLNSLGKSEIEYQESREEYFKKNQLRSIINVYEFIY